MLKYFFQKYGKYLNIYDDMEYLKLFETNQLPDDWKVVWKMGQTTVPEYYETISELEGRYGWRQDCEQFRSVSEISMDSISKSDFNRIISELNPTIDKSQGPYGWRIDREGGNNTITWSTHWTNPDTGRRFTRCLWIWKFDDDWYIVSDVIQFGGKTCDVDWFKCDQWDGLMKLLKDKEIILSK